MVFSQKIRKKIENKINQVQAKKHIKEDIIFSKDPEQIKIINDLKNKGFEFYKDSNDWYWLQKTKYFPIEFVIMYDNKRYVYRQIDSTKFKNLGYGICGYKMLFHDFTNDIYCDGIHAHVNPTTKKLCLPLDLIHKPINVDTMRLVEDTFCIMDMRHSYFSHNIKEISKIRSLIQ